MHRLGADLASRMARLAVDNIGREYPNAPALLLRSSEDLAPPRAVHPAFFGSFDWHSCVHQHWLLVRLLRLDALGPDEADAARAALGTTLTPANLEAEARYLRDRPTFERTYGWAWLLALTAELSAWTDADARRWRDALQPPVEVVVENWLAFLDRTTYPIRAGTHANTAFGMLLALRHAGAAGRAAFAEALSARAVEWFGEDRAYPAHLEPGGDDFLSGALAEATLMSRVLDSGFGPWLEGFLPNLGDDEPAALFEPAFVGDRADAKTVHLDGLNLSRAWCWRTIAAALPAGDARVERAKAAAERHLDSAMPELFSGEYVGEHWLSTFALLALTEPDAAL